MASSKTLNVPGRIKSFSQKSGWGFIQLFENGIDSPENYKDVFFHRADVDRTGTHEIRPGILVHCSVVSTGKGEKACDIIIVDDLHSEAATSATPSSETETTSLFTAKSEGTLSHCPYRTELSVVCLPPPAPSSAPVALYALRGAGNFARWSCTQCVAQNVVQRIQRVGVVCASCGLGHQVESWVCECCQLNERSSRHCSSCDTPFALGCQELVVELGQPGDHVVQPRSRGSPRIRSRWQHSTRGWSHPLLESSEVSLWCQDTQCASLWDKKSINDTMTEKCRGRLEWAYTWLAKKPLSDDTPLNTDWLYRFSEEVVKPDHRLLCTCNGLAAFVPNPCVDAEDSDGLRMYEALGMVLALAIAQQVPLYPTFPMWLARTLLGYPTTVNDLTEYDSKLWNRIAMVESAADVEALGLSFKEEITRYGVKRSFEVEHAPPVTNANKQDYLVWLKDVYLSTSIEPQLRQIKHGFFFALMGHHVMQSLSPMKLVELLNGTCQ